MSQNSTVRVAFLDVGQGDTIIASVPEKHEAVIVDCLDAEAAISYVERNDIQYIRSLIITHLHLDHCKGAIKLINNIRNELNLDCERVFFLTPIVTNQVWRKLRDDEDGHSDSLANEDGSTGEKSKGRQRRDILTELRRWKESNILRYIRLARQADTSLPLPEFVELIHPWEAHIETLMVHSLNDTSGVLKIKGSGSSALLTGDLEPTGWKRLKENYKNLHSDLIGLRSDVLKFPHHGAWKNCNPDDLPPDDLLDTVDPSVVVISVGTTGINYCHPNSHVFDTLAQRPHIRLLCTQATEQCVRAIKDKQSKIVEQFRKHAAETGDFFIERRDCPCAGTIIVELGESVRILQPSLEFHCDHIIKSHFPEHRCSISNLS